MQAIYHFGHKILFDSYLTIQVVAITNILTSIYLLFDSYLMI